MSSNTVLIWLNRHSRVSFTGNELMDWLNQTMPYADELRVCFGTYPAGDPNAGRVTVILWPYKNGEPANKPVTEGKDGATAIKYRLIIKVV